MSERDSLRRFLFDRFPVRGEIVCLEQAWQAVLARHDYPEVVRDVLGQAMAASALLASTLKFDGTLTMQLQGSGPIHLLVVQCTSGLSMRGLAKWKGEPRAGSFGAMVGDGRLAITIESGAERERYQGIVPIEGDTLADCLQAYFRTSEQLPTRLWLAASDAAAAGMLLQKLPSVKMAGAEDEDAWPRVQALAETVRDAELLELTDIEVLHRLFNEEDVRVHRNAPVSFHCSCSRERIERVLRMLGESEVRDLIEEQGRIEVRCEFCNMAWELDPVDAEALFVTATPAPASDSLH